MARNLPRIAKALLICLLVLGAILGGVTLLMLRLFSGSSREIAREIPAGTTAYPISISRAFEASSHGGWHGDGTSLSAYRFPASQSPALLAALKEREPGYVWREIKADFNSLGDLKSLLPRDFLPSSGRSMIMEGRPAEGPPYREYVICPSEGLFYSIRHQF